MREQPQGEPTCWTLIRGAAQGIADDRSDFAQRYLPLARAFFTARWRGSPLAGHVDDAAQDVFLECFRANGALQKADPQRPHGFRAFLMGVVANVARRHERSWVRRQGNREPGSFHPDEFQAAGKTPSKLFDRAWAIALIQQAADLQEKLAAEGDEEQRTRVELLKLRFAQGLPIREIAQRWAADPDVLHSAYRRAKSEYRRCLREVVEFHCIDGADIEAECERLLAVVE